jgi:hypothetical protein
MPRFRLTFLDDPPAAVSLLAPKAECKVWERDLSWDGVHTHFFLPLASVAVLKLPSLCIA